MVRRKSPPRIYEYDDNGIRISQTINGVKTIYVVNANNPTGYSQVLEEKNPSTDLVEKTYTIGLDVHTLATAAAVYHHLYDGHGSTRALLNAAGNVVEKYAYDAYGNLLPLAGYIAAVDQALTSLLYSGEQTDRTGLQYLRARYYDPTTGRFNRLDPFAGGALDPLSLHKYLYAHGSPISGMDPSGMFIDFSGFATGLYIGVKAASAALNIYSGIQGFLNGLEALYSGDPLGAALNYLQGTVNPGLGLLEAFTPIGLTRIREGRQA